MTNSQVVSAMFPLPERNF